MKELTGMDVGELERYLFELKTELEEVEQERTYVLGQTGVHLSGKTAGKYEAEIGELKAAIGRVEQLIRCRHSS